MQRLIWSSSGIFAAIIVLLNSAPDQAPGQPPMGGPSGPFGGGKRQILKQFDADGSGWLDRQERAAARNFVIENPPSRRGFGGRGGSPTGPGGGRGFGPPGGSGPTGDFGPGPQGPPERFGAPPGAFGPPPGFGPGFGPPPGGFGPPPEFGPPRAGERRGEPEPPRQGRRPGDDRRPDGPGGGFGPGGFGPGGFGPGGFGPGGFGPAGGPPGMRRDRPEPAPGQRVEKDAVEPIDAPLYDTSVLRTIFIDFEADDWESELEDFHGTDVDVAATLTVDGKSYPNCGIRFRGASSYNMVPRGYKRSLNVSVDMADDEQRIGGYKTLNLLNSASDDSMMSTVLYSQIARQYIPAPKANFVRVVINGEDWGIYVNAQQFNKEFIVENFGTDQGARWKVSGSPRGGGGLDYRGEDPANYQHPYEQKSGGKKALAKLIDLCRVLEQTPTDELPAALQERVNVDGLLWFLALDIGLINNDGYWTRASDYSIYLDGDDKFHFIPHDMNEAFRPAGGPGMGPRGGPLGETRALRGHRGAVNDTPVALDPLIGLDDPSKPLRSRVLAVPEYREQYLRNLRELAQSSLQWNKLAPFIASQVELIDPVVRNETRLVGSYERFRAAIDPKPQDGTGAQRRGGLGGMSLRQFIEHRQRSLKDEKSLKSEESLKGEG